MGVFHYGKKISGQLQSIEKLHYHSTLLELWLPFLDFMTNNKDPETTIPTSYNFLAIFLL